MFAVWMSEVPGGFQGAQWMGQERRKRKDEAPRWLPRLKGQLGIATVLESRGWVSPSLWQLCPAAASSMVPRRRTERAHRARV